MPVLIVNPRSDSAFVAMVERSLREGMSPSELQARIREHYPLAVVRTRDLAAEPNEIWYVYRDGRWRADRDGG